MTPARTCAVLGLLLAAALVPATVAWPSHPRARPVAIRGHVRAQGCGVAGIGVTDGVVLVRTAPDGSFALESRTDRAWLSLCGPGGEPLRCTAGFDACLVRRIRADGDGRMRVRFDVGALRVAPCRQ